MDLIAFDPSLRNLGVAVGRVEDNKLIVEYVDTFYIDKMVEKLSLTPDWDIDPNTRRVHMLEDITTKFLRSYAPDAVVIELPIFNGKNPNSLQVQMKAIVTLELAVLKYHERLRLNIVEYMPNVIKMGVGVDPKKDKGGKDDITNALVKLQDAGVLVYSNPNHGPREVDDHANDAVAMLFTKYSELVELDEGLYR